MTSPYIDQGLRHAGSAEVLTTGMFDEPAGTLARTIPQGLVSGGGLSILNTTGLVGVRGVPLAAGTPVPNIAVFFGGTAAVTPAHLWFGLLDIGLNVLAVSADQLAAAQGPSAEIKLAMTGPLLIVPQTGLYYIAVSSTAATAPTLGGLVMATGSLATTPTLCGSAGTQSLPPAVGTQLAAGTVTASINANFRARVAAV